MQTVESIKKQIDSAEDLQSIVKTMKALAAVSIRQYEEAVKSLAEYSRTVEMALSVILKERLGKGATAKTAPEKRLGAVIFGSDQGMCGPLNDRIATHATEAMDELGFPPEDRVLLAVGQRVVARLKDGGQSVDRLLPVPNSVRGINATVQEILLEIGEWQSRRDLEQVVLFYSKQLSGASYEPHTVHLLPVDQRWLEDVEAREWPFRTLPTFTMNWDDLFSALIRQYLFVSLYRAFAESLASENASRLASMQSAEQNIEEHIDELNSEFHHQRQMSITSELLDIAAGFEALAN